MNLNLRVLCVLFVCVAPALRAAPPETVSIAFKPTAAPVQYWVSSVEQESRHALAELPKWHVVQGLGLVQQAVQQTADGRLAVAVSSRARTVAVERKLVQTGEEQKPETFSYTMSAQGERSGQKDLGALSSPVFPAGPIAVGTSWKVAVPPTATFRLPFEITHTLEAVQVVDGARCAIVRTSGTARGPDATAGCLVRVDIAGTGTFDLAAGAWLKSRTSITVAAIFDKPQPGGHQVLARSLVRWVRRRAPGEARPPSRFDK